MKGLSLSILFIMLGLMAYAQQQFPSQVWHDGKVILMENEQLVGKVKYNLDNNLVQISDGRTIDTFSAMQVRNFEIFDEQYGDFRYFYSVPYLGEEAYERPIFFEVLFEGSLTLLAREFVITEGRSMMNNPWMMGGGAFWWPYERLSFHFYLLDARTGRIVEYNQKRKMLLDFMGNHSKAVQQYMKANNLKTDRRSDLTKIVSYYNGLVR